MDLCTRRSISDGVEHNTTTVGRNVGFGLSLLIEINQSLGNGLTNQAREDLAIIFRDSVDLRLIVWSARGAGGGIAIAWILLSLERILLERLISNKKQGRQTHLSLSVGFVRLDFLILVKMKDSAIHPDFIDQKVGIT
jgi:hypothetical protein